MEYFMCLPLLKVTIITSAGQPQLLWLCRRQWPAPKHSIFKLPEHNLHHNKSITQSAHGAVAPGKRHLQTEAVKGAGHEHLNANSFHLFPSLLSKGFCREHPRVKVKRCPSRLCL